MPAMMKLKTKLSLFNLFSKLAFTAIFLIILPYIIERINLRYVDNELIENRERVIGLISDIGIEPFITSDSADAFGSYNILKEEFISLERIETGEEMNFIEVTQRLIEGEEIYYRVLNYSFLVNDQNYLLEVGKSLTSILITEKNIRRVLFLFLVLIILITFIADFQYTRLVLRPLDAITRKLKLIPDPSQFDKTPVNTSTEDFQKLDRALADLMENINLLFQNEKEITINISHELLTPVSVLRSKLENLLLSENIDPGIQNKIEESLKTLHRLQSLVNSLLLIARIESRQYLREESFSVKELLEEIISEIKPVSDDSGVGLHYEAADDFILNKANRTLIFSMFYNVINNAVKNTLPGGEVMIRTSGLPDRFNVSVSDTGKGISESQMKNLFLRFKMRNENSGDGTGIGLAIAKTIADFHKIDVIVTSEINKGSNFSFNFPKIS
jgi:signal transduction histidine kinase